MLKVSHRTLIVISGLVWLCVGVFLLSLGLSLIKSLIQGIAPIAAADSILIGNLSKFIGGHEQAAILLIGFSLIVGYCKARFVLSKSIKKGVQRILTLSNPASLHLIYSRKYYILLGSMVALGMLIKFINAPNDIRGAVDIIIGAALTNGALLYFRAATNPQKDLAA